MKQYTNDKYLTDDNLDNFYYDNINGCIRKKNSNKIMRSKSTFGKPIIVINSKSIEQNRIVCKLNKISFSPTCKIEHIDGDINNLHVENLKIVPFSLCLSENENTELDIFKNDKYMPDMFKLYFYEPISGKVFNRKTNRQVKTLKNGYVRVSFLVNGVSIRIPAHRFAMWHSGIDIQNKEVDHINGVRDDNRLINLRITERYVNRRNSAKCTINKTGIAGVCWHKHQKSWYVTICNKHVGYFHDFFEACCIRKSIQNNLGKFTNRHGCEEKSF